MIITLSVVGMTIIYSGLVWAMNSLVSPDDIGRMKRAKISDAVIQMLIAEQTCSVTGEFLMKLKSAGAEGWNNPLLSFGKAFTDLGRFLSRHMGKYLPNLFPLHL